MAATVTPQPLVALVSANAKRDRIATLRHDILAGKITLQEVLQRRPPELAAWPIVDVLRLGYRKRSVSAITALGRRAVRDDINLLVPLGEASRHTLQWVAANARWTHRPNGGFVLTAPTETTA